MDKIPIKDSKKENSILRNSNLELYRIIVMFLIVSHHYVVNSGLMSSNGPIQTAPFCAKSLFYLIFGMWGKTGINCFVLITGYFMCKSRITFKKFFRLLFEIYFYKIIIYMIFILCGYTEFNLHVLVDIFIPFIKISDNFLGCFLVFYCTIPFLTILVQNMNEKYHRYLLLLCGVIYVLIGTIPGCEITFNYVSWFAVLFFIASYLRLYPKSWSNNTKLWGALSILSIGISVCSVIVMTWIGVKTGRSDLYYWFVADANKLLAVTTSIATFMFFKQLKINNSKLINTISASMFGVLCIHANSDVMRQWLWKDLLNNVGAYESDFFALHAFFSVLVVFVICILLDQLRIRFVEKRIIERM